MSQRFLDVPQGQGGGPVQLAKAAKYPRSLLVTVSSIDAAVNHAAFLARTRRELQNAPTFGQTGFVVVVLNTAAATALVVGGVSYATLVIEGWAGELWACADATGKVQIDVMDSASTES